MKKPLGRVNVLIIGLWIVMFSVFFFLDMERMSGGQIANETYARVAPEFAREHFPVLSRQAVLIPHILIAFPALFVGGYQIWFSKRLKTSKNTHIHRVMGYVYTTLVVGVLVTGWFLLPHIFGGWLEAAGGLVFGEILLAFFTFRGIWYVLIHRIPDHRADICRSCAMLAGAIVIRMIFPIITLSGVPERLGLGLAFWVGWPMTWFYCEYLMGWPRLFGPMSPPQKGP